MPTNQYDPLVTKTLQLNSLEKNDQALQSEIERQLLTIGKRVRSLHKRGSDASPFSRHKAIMDRLRRLESLEHARNANQMRLRRVREQLRKKVK